MLSYHRILLSGKLAQLWTGVFIFLTICFPLRVLSCKKTENHPSYLLHLFILLCLSHVLTTPVVFLRDSLAPPLLLVKAPPLSSLNSPHAADDNVLGFISRLSRHRTIFLPSSMPFLFSVVLL